MKPVTLLAACALTGACGSSSPAQREHPAPAPEPLAPAAPEEPSAPEQASFVQGRGAPAPRPPLPAPHEETVGQRLARTIDAVRKDPDLRVVVRLEVPVASEAELAGQEDGDNRIKAQRRAISQAQNAWLQAFPVDADRAGVRTFQTRPYLTLRMEASALEQLRDAAYDEARGTLSIDGPGGPIVFDLEPDVALKENAAPGAAAPMHKAIVATQAASLHARGMLGAGALIAVVDDGVDLAPTLEGAGGTSRVTGGASFTSHMAEPCSGGAASTSCTGLEAGRPLARLPDWSHGTKVATVAASSAFDTIDPYLGTMRHASGIAPAAEVLTLRVKDGNGQIWSEDVAAALESLALSPDPALAAVNLSLGSEPSFSGDCAPTTPVELLVHDYVADLMGLGAAVVVSAGNEGYGVLGFPACLDNVITVGCVNIDYQSMLISNWSTSVDVLAPGHGLLLPTGPTYGGLAASGTSMATPQVAGAIALLRAAYPTCTTAQIVDAMLNHVSRPFAQDGITRPYLSIEDAALWLEATCAPPAPSPVEAGTGGSGSPGVAADAGGG